MPKILRIICMGVMILYPFVVFTALQNHIGTKYLAAVLLTAVLTGFVNHKKTLFLLTGLILTGLLFCLDNAVFLKLYPVLINTLFLITFALSLGKEKTIIALCAEKMGHVLTPNALDYTRKVTLSWCLFFICNMSFSLISCFLSDTVWMIYNGCIAYILIGLMMSGEWWVRKKYVH